MGIYRQGSEIGLLHTQALIHNTMGYDLLILLRMGMFSQRDAGVACFTSLTILMGIGSRRMS